MRERHDTGGRSVSLLRRMARFDDLPADQKAVLQLVLRQGRTYGEIAGLLKISTEAVRDRALTALDARRADGPARARRRPPGRGRRLPAGPAVGLGPRHDARAARRLASRPATGRAASRPSCAPPAWPATTRCPRSRPTPPRSTRPSTRCTPAVPPAPTRRARRASAACSSSPPCCSCVVGGVLVLTGVIGGERRRQRDSRRRRARRPRPPPSRPPPRSSSRSTSPPPSGAKKPLGVANIVSQDGQRALAVVGQDLPASGHYVLWVRDGTKSKFLGFFPPVTGSGADKGRLQGLVAAPSDLASYKRAAGDARARQHAQAADHDHPEGRRSAASQTRRGGVQRRQRRPARRRAACARRA